MDSTTRAALKAAVSVKSKERAHKYRRVEDQLERMATEEVVLTMPSKGGEVSELIGHIRKAGFKVVRSGNQKHYKIQDKGGRIVTDDNGPLIISTSPSDFRWREMHVQRLMRAGVLKTDPYKATGKQSRGPQNGNGHGPEEDDGPKKTPEEMRKERERDATAAVARTRSSSAIEGTAKLRARFEPIVPHLGGWAQGAGPRAHLSLTTLRVLTIGEVAAVMHHWAVARGRMELPRDRITKAIASPKEAESAARGLKQGSTISEKWQPLAAVFLDDLWRDAGNDPKLAAGRYMHLLREEKGLVEPPESPRAGPAIEAHPLIPAPEPPRARAREREGAARIGPLHQLKPSMLAFETLYRLAAAGEPEERAIALAMQIAELDLQRQQEEEER